MFEARQKPRNMVTLRVPRERAEVIELEGNVAEIATMTEVFPVRAKHQAD